MAPCYLAFGRHLKVPMIATVTCSFHDWLNEVSGNPFNPAYIPSLFSTFQQQMNFKERVINVLLSHFISAQIHYYTSFQVEHVKKYFGIEDASIIDLYNDISLYLVNSHSSLNGIRPLTPAVVEVGGLQIKDDGEPLSPVRWNKLTFLIIHSARVSQSSLPGRNEARPTESGRFIVSIVANALPFVSSSFDPNGKRLDTRDR